MHPVAKFLYLAVSLCVGIIVGTGLVVKYENSTIQPWMWKDPPIIVNCYGDDFNELYVVRGVDYWTTRGQHFAFIEQNPPKEVCDMEKVGGFIMLKKRKVDKGDGTLAITRREVLFGEIRSVVIFFNPGSFKLENIVEHELGHALGFQHVEIEGHIMHPTYDKMGDKFWVP